MPPPERDTAGLLSVAWGRLQQQRGGFQSQLQCWWVPQAERSACNFGGERGRGQSSGGL